MAFGNRVLTTTNQEIMPRLVDTILNSNVFASMALANAKPWRGERIKFPIKYQKNATGTSFTGFDTFSTSASNTRVNMEYTSTNYQITVALPIDEISVNQSAGDLKILDIISTEVKSAAQDMADDIGTLFYGDGTGNSNKDFLGLGAIVDDGSTVATIGGLSRSTYPTLASTVTASGGTLTLAKMATLYNAITSGMQKPTHGFTTEAIFALYEQLLQPQERIAKDVPMMRTPGGSMGKKGQGPIGATGFTGLFYKGFPILADEKCTAQTLFFLNMDYIHWLALPMYGQKPVQYSPVEIVGNDYENVLGLGFSWSEWIKPTNSAAVVGHVYLGGNLVTDNPKRHGKLTGISGV